MTTNTKLEERFNEKFKCINRDCDGRGNIPVQNNEGDWEAEQCQFCFEYRFPLLAFIAQERAQVVKECMEALPGEHHITAKNSSDEIAVYMATGWNGCRAAALEALSRIGQEHE